MIAGRKVRYQINEDEAVRTLEGFLLAIAPVDDCPFCVCVIETSTGAIVEVPTNQVKFINPTTDATAPSSR